MLVGAVLVAPPIVEALVVGEPPLGFTEMPLAPE